MPRDDGPAWPAQRIVGNAARLPLRDAVTPCIVTSPPYNVSIQGYPSGYKDSVPWNVYAARTKLWAKEMARVLTIGGRVWLNVQATVPLVRGDIGGQRVDLEFMWKDALFAAGLSYRDTICWVQDNYDGGCAWGSWCKPSAPNLRGSHEMILLFHKGPWKRTARPALKKWTDEREGLGGDWVDLTRNVWKIPPANKGKMHPDYGSNSPAPFPIELPARAIRLSTWPNELVLDPFAGRGTTGWAAEQLGRKSIMIDLGF